MTIPTPRHLAAVLTVTAAAVILPAAASAFTPVTIPRIAECTDPIGFTPVTIPLRPAGGGSDDPRAFTPVTIPRVGTSDKLAFTPVTIPRVGTSDKLAFTPVTIPRQAPGCTAPRAALRPPVA